MRKDDTNKGAGNVVRLSQERAQERDLDPIEEKDAMGKVVAADVRELILSRR